MREPKRSASRARFPAKLRDMARNWPQVLQWDQAERTLIIKDRTRFSKNTTGIKWSSFRRQLGRYGFYKHDWRTGVPGIVFANCDPRVVTIDDLAGLVRIPPQKMRETTRAQLGHVRKNDKFRALLLENDKLRAAIRENLGSRADQVLREISAAVAAAEGPSRVVTDDDSMGASPPEEANAPATPRDTGHIDEDLSAPLYDAEELDVDLFDFDGSEDMSLL